MKTFWTFFDSLFYDRSLTFELNNNWDICLNGWNLDSFLIFKMMEQMRYSMMLLDQESYRNNISNFQSSILNISCFKLIRAFGTACYSISPLGAKKLLSSLLPLDSIHVYFPGLNKDILNNGIDISMNSLYEQMNSFVVFPPISFPLNYNETSTIQIKSELRK